MAVHYNYLDEVLPQVQDGHAIQFITDLQKVIAAGAIALLLIIVGKLLTARMKSKKDLEALVVPDKKPSMFGFVDLLVENFIEFHDSILGKERRKYVPFNASLFFFIFLINLLGVIPGMPAATTTVWINVGMALVVFIYFNVEGVRELGLANYLKHFAGGDAILGLYWGLVLLLAPLLFTLEIISTCLRVLTLNLRLYWNITADHEVLGIFADLLRSTYIGAVPFYGLAFFVSFMQAFVFTILTMIYILLATQHEEEGH